MRIKSGRATNTEPPSLIQKVEDFDLVLNKYGWIERCVDAMAVSVPKADIFQRVVKLGRQAGVAAKLGRRAA